MQMVRFICLLVSVNDVLFLNSVLSSHSLPAESLLFVRVLIQKLQAITSFISIKDILVVNASDYIIRKKKNFFFHEKLHLFLMIYIRY